MSDRDTEMYYRLRAPEYEQIYYREAPERRQEIDDEATFLRDISTGKEVLEIACGTGYWTSIVSETAASIVASDISPEMIAIARGKKYHCPVMFCRSDLEQLPFAGSAFDLIVVGFWFSHHPRQEHHSFLEQIQHPLKNNGLIWLIDNNPPAEGPTNESHHVDEYGNNYKRRFLDNDEEHIILKNYFTEDELVDIFARRFHIARLIHKTYYWSILLKKGAV
ncbi:MAG: methyltransferase domain-containing protein [candidate division Zixibacteria bacterium]|nr:methyltransferase domain-containing protein [candidate division Zixibacteria bacterium]